MNLTDKQLEEIIEKHPTHNICNLHSLSIHISPAEALACSECQKETKGMQIK